MTEEEVITQKLTELDNLKIRCLAIIAKLEATREKYLETLRALHLKELTEEEVVN